MAKKRTKGRKVARAGDEQLSGLDAAAKVLAICHRAGWYGARVAEIVAIAKLYRLWTPRGKTPAATLRAALNRDVQTKGRKSRFKKRGRGVFAARRKGA